MRKLQLPRQGRAGFTLLELLVVVAIIAILLALTGAGVMRVLNASTDLQNRSDVDGLAKALEKFKLKYKIYPPSRIVLSNDPAFYQSPQGRDSATLLVNIFGNQLPITTGSIDWSGGIMKAKYGKDKYTVLLEGDQCLVFFLGGIPNADPPACRGFSSNPRNPADLSRLEKPLYEYFKSDRLYNRSQDNPFFSFKDAYGSQPFAYFSSGLRENGYSDTDCQSLGVGPYFTSTVPSKKYISPKSFQLISAGRDGQFGPGGLYNPSAGSVQSSQGLDDISNFHPYLLGTPK